ncbi:Uncharacterised protein [Mycobacteroides abscessus subsp. abscessus]|nr:Uncharacterised protein [Mycobacteroides abscessus subsp. abscessus]
MQLAPHRQSVQVQLGLPQDPVFSDSMVSLLVMHMMLRPAG